MFVARPAKMIVAPHAIGGEHPVEVDECLLGGRTRGEGHGVHHKATVVGAVEVRKRQDAEARAAKHRQEHDGGVPLKKLVYAGRLRLRVVDGRRATRLETFVTDNVAKGSTVRTDGWQRYGGRVLPASLRELTPG